jgi:signal peptide peptidase SppA
MWRFLRGVLMPWRASEPRVAVVPLTGVIASAGRLGSGLSLTGLARVIERAFETKPTAVALAINSPGGSAAQSHLIFKRIRALAEEKAMPVFAFVEDVGASGGYMLACAADEIYADESSIIGSIGVISSGFGFTGLIEKLGVERRVYAAGEHKGALDAFKPEDPEEIARLTAIQSDVHTLFKDLVRTRRGSRLKGEESELFSGAFWAGHRAHELGLVDGIGDLKTILRARYGKKTRFQTFAAERGLLRRRLGIGFGGGNPFSGLGAGLAEEGLAALEVRALWNRFGL